MIFEMLERLLENGRRRAILTVSSVPLQVTFAGGDTATRNAYSKSLLRVVSELAVQGFADIDYFVSYGNITIAGLQAFGQDNVHLRPAMVEQVINHMVQLFVVCPLPPGRTGLWRHTLPWPWNALGGVVP